MLSNADLEFHESTPRYVRLGATALKSQCLPDALQARHGPFTASRTPIARSYAPYSAGLCFTVQTNTHSDDMVRGQTGDPLCQRNRDARRRTAPRPCHGYSYEDTGS